MFRRMMERLAGRWLAAQGTELHEVHGFRVVVENGRADIRTDDVLERLGDALALIERHQPWRLRHLRRDLAEFLVVRYPCRGAYFPEHRSCLTELTFLARRDISAATVASSIVHEGIHARVDRMRTRFGGTWAERDPAREERLCRRAELAFGRSLPAELGAPVVERALASLTLGDEEVAPVIDWNVASRRIAQADQDAMRGGQPGA